MGDKLFAIPKPLLTADEDRKVFVLDIDRETLERATGFDKGNWLDMADRSWGQEICAYYRATPYWGDLL